MSGENKVEKREWGWENEKRGWGWENEKRGWEWENEKINEDEKTVLEWAEKIKLRGENENEKKNEDEKIEY